MSANHSYTVIFDCLFRDRECVAILAYPLIISPTIRRVDLLSFNPSEHVIIIDVYYRVCDNWHLMLKKNSSILIMTMCTTCRSSFSPNYEL